jgi:hypothetical protein
LIISHQHRFIFVKTHKTAGSSLEVALARECGADDVVSHMEDNIASGIPRNYGPTSRWGPWYNGNKLARKLIPRHSPRLGDFYYEHMPATRIRELVGDEVWSSYFTFCFDRNPWDKVVSYYLWKQFGQARQMPEFSDYIHRKAHRLPVDSALYCDTQGELMVDRIYEFRELPAALDDLRGRLGLVLPEPLPREKTAIASERKPYPDYYDDAGREHIARLFAREIQIMGYRFGA